MRFTEEQINELVSYISPQWGDYDTHENIHVTGSIYVNFSSYTWNPDYVVEVYDDELEDYIEVENVGELKDRLDEELYRQLREKEENDAAIAETESYLDGWLRCQGNY